MKKFIARVLSFILDIMFVTLIVGALIELPVFDEYSNKIDIVRYEATKAQEKYELLNKKIDDILDDSLVSDDEYNYILTNFIEYQEVFEDIKPNTDITKEYIDNVHDDIDNIYKDIYNDELFRLAKDTRYQNIITIIVYLLYFGLLQYILRGQTIFKRLFKIKVVDSIDIQKRVSLWKFIIRTVLVCDVIFMIADIVTISNLGFDNYLSCYSIIRNIKFFYEVGFVLVMFLRDDQKGIQDLLLNTKVIRYDKSGKVQKDIIFKVDDSEDNNKKIREEVKAIKVND